MLSFEYNFQSVFNGGLEVKVKIGFSQVYLNLTQG